MAICRLLLGKIKKISLPILLTFLLLNVLTALFDIYSPEEESDNSIKSFTRTSNRTAIILLTTSHLGNLSGPFRTRTSNRTATWQTTSHLGNLSEPTEKSLLACLQCETHFQHSKEESEDEVDAKRTGYVLALNFRDQQTRASNNLFSLQCWAKTLFVNIVEPFVINSHLILPMSENQQMYVKFREMFDIKKWQVLTTQHRFAPLVSWDQFVAKAPRKMIVVRFRYEDTGEGVDLELNSNINSYTEGCESTQELHYKIHYMKSVLNFTIVRDVCLNFAQGDELTPFQFNRHIFGGIGPKTVTIVMEEWRGLTSGEDGKHVVLFDGCSLGTKVRPVAWPSSQLMCDAKKYVHKYLGTESYIALILRSEKIDSLSGDEASMIQCLNKTLLAWRKLKKISQIQSTFLSIDIGSYSLMKQKGETKYFPYIHLFSKFLKDIFGAYATIKTWEMGFEEVAIKKDPGYIASLQKTIAMMSKCIIFIGGGSFQKHTKYMYERLNRNRMCTKIIQECSI